MACNTFTGALNFASYNLHGFKNGYSLLLDLCRSHQIIGVQEHWLTKQNLHRFSSIHSEFNYYGVSGMNSAMSKGILRGRPFGGVCILWHKSLSSQIVYIGGDADGRCIAARLTIASRSIILFLVYFPCMNNSLQYKAELGLCLEFISDVMLANVGSDDYGRYEF